jgi:uncharacterized protein (DUF1015 family)
MTKIAPLKAVIYNREKIKDLAKVVCPPYDIISDQAQQYYHDLSPYNLIYMLLGKNISGEDKYKRAAGYFKNWLKEGTLIRDDNPAIYFYSQEYTLKGEKKTRVGFIARLYLDDKNSSTFGHEHTRLESKEDRLRLLKAVKANLSPIFVLFSDQKRIIPRVYQQHIQNAQPFLEITDNEKIIHKIWRLDSPDILEMMQSDMKNKNIFIADGHHRYEVSCAYRDEMRRKIGSYTGEEDFNYTLAYFTNVESRGLTIMPIHRLVKLDLNFDMDKFQRSLRDYFDIQDIKEKRRFIFLMEKAGNIEHIIGLYKEEKYWLLRLKNVKILDKLIADKSPKYRSLDVSILNYLVLKNNLGINLDDKERVTFNANVDELIEFVNNNSSYIAFFLNPVKIQQIISLALDNEKMPAKSTYFYPKVLSGLVINKHE